MSFNLNSLNYCSNNISILGNTNQSQQQQQQPPNINDLVINSIVNCKLFGDERDQVICKLNLLQACWGTGKGKNLFFQYFSIKFCNKF